jgi:hypothetical protein
MDVQILQPVPNEYFENISNILKSITIPKLQKNKVNSVRLALPDNSRSVTMGMILKRIGRKFELSAFTLKYPQLYEELKILIHNINPNFQYTSIQVNHNVTCNRHRDKGNIGKSIIISTGDYTGCNFVIENDVYNTYHQPISFDGSKLLHWNTNDLVGNKYSFVFYNSKYSTSKYSKK